ncbi:MAG: AraC family transcriptional regulator [Bacteroidota bacterium]
MLILPRDLVAQSIEPKSDGSPSINLLHQSKDLIILSKSLRSPIYERTGYLATHAASFVLQGEQQIETYEGDFFRVGAGQAMILPRDLYQISDLVPKNGSFKSLLIYFNSPDQLLNISGSHKGAKGRLARSATPASVPFSFGLKSETSKMLQTITNDSSTTQVPDLVRALFTLQSKVEKTFTQKLAGIRAGKRRELKPFMQDQADKALRVEDFAYLTGRSLSTFRRDFKAAFGQAPRQWLRAKRLEHAYNIIAQGDQRVSDLAQAAGYENVSYFIREFRKQYGQSPKQLMMAKGAAY